MNYIQLSLAIVDRIMCELACLRALAFIYL
uniref:Uncharacterized protein n=1 Tax=Anguilla anguilla TaxID=7936 RepID=A0A0E9RWY3_ANGAN